MPAPGSTAPRKIYLVQPRFPPSYWGQEHLLGSTGLQNTSTAYQVGHKLAQGLANYVAATLGTAPGVVPAAQSALVPVTAMQVVRSSDSGIPTVGTFPAQSYTP